MHLSVDEQVIKTLLEFEPDLQSEDENGDTPLNNLIFWDAVTIRVIKMLLRQGSDINKPNHAGQTLLFKAVTKTDLAIARLLLDRGASPNHASEDRGTPLHMACERGTVEAVKLILERIGFVEKPYPFVGTSLGREDLFAICSCIRSFVTICASLAPEKRAETYCGGYIVRDVYKTNLKYRSS